MKVVYITGCLGFIGSHVTRLCLKQGWYVRGIDKCTYAANLNLLTEFNEYDNFEFENEDISKFVHLDKSHKMICQFNHKFKKWIPIKLANEKSEIIKDFEIKNIYKIYDENKKKQFTKK